MPVATLARAAFLAQTSVSYSTDGGLALAAATPPGNAPAQLRQRETASHERTERRPRAYHVGHRVVFGKLEAQAPPPPVRSPGVQRIQGRRHALRRRRLRPQADDRDSRACQAPASAPVSSDTRGASSGPWPTDGWIFEARETNRDTAEFHGYPVLATEAIARAVFNRFSDWVAEHGTPEEPLRQRLLPAPIRAPVVAEFQILIEAPAAHDPSGPGRLSIRLGESYLTRAGPPGQP